MSKPKYMTPEQEAAWNEKERARKAALYQRKKEQYKAANELWKENNREKMRQYQRDYVARHPERVKANFEKHYETNHSKILERSSARYKRMKEECPSVLKDQRAVVAQNRRAQKIGSGGKLSYGRITRLMKLQKGKCAVCRCDLSDSGKHVDHVIPLALGGSHDDHNIQLLCPACNLSKSAKHPVEFMQSRGFLL